MVKNESALWVTQRLYVHCSLAHFDVGARFFSVMRPLFERRRHDGSGNRVSSASGSRAPLEVDQKWHWAWWTTPGPFRAADNPKKCHGEQSEPCSVGLKGGRKRVRRSM